MTRRLTAKELGEGQRAGALSVKEFLIARKWLRWASMFMAVGVMTSNPVLVQVSAMVLNHRDTLLTARNIPAPELHRTHLRFAHLPEADAWRFTRFRKQHLRRLKRSLGIPGVIEVPRSGNNTNYRVNGEEALLVYLMRMATAKRWVDIQPHFGMQLSMMSEIFYAVHSHVMAEKAHLVQVS